MKNNSMTSDQNSTQEPRPTHLNLVAPPADSPSGGVSPAGPPAAPRRRLTGRVGALNAAGGPGHERIRLLIADDDGTEARSLHLALAQCTPLDLVGIARDGAECLNLARRHKPDIVLLKDILQVVDSLRVAETLADELPEVRAILMTTGWIHIESHWHDLLHAGIAGFVTYPPHMDNLLEQIDHIVRHQETLRHHLASRETSAPAAETTQMESRVVAFAAPRGGCGRSILASNLAVTLAGRERSVCLVDLNIEGGDIASLLDVRTGFSLADLALAAEDVDRDMVAGVMAQHPSGVRVLPAPRPGVVRAEALTPYFIQNLLGHARVHHEFTLVDAASGFTGPVESVVEIADAVIAVIGFDLVRLQQGATFLAQLAEAGFDQDRILVVLSSESDQALMALQDAERVLDCHIACILPFDPATIVESINSGVPFVTSAPNKPISRAVRALARKVSGDFKAPVLPWWKRMLHLSRTDGRTRAA